MTVAPGEVARLRDRVRHLSEIRSQAVHASAEKIRRIKRDLHDGAQLMSVAMHLGMADDMFERDPVAARAMLERARVGAGEAMTDLRDLIRGIVPSGARRAWRGRRGRSTRCSHRGAGRAAPGGPAPAASTH